MTPQLLGPLFTRDLQRLRQELASFPNDASLWQSVPGITNPAGNLALHLEGNLRQYIGRELAGIPYTRDRDLEFGTKALTQADLLARVDQLAQWLPNAVEQLPSSQLHLPFPTEPWGYPVITGQFLLHLYGHLQYHLGQIDYIRRAVTGNGAIAQAGLR
jgi:hypothetical protein